MAGRGDGGGVCLSARPSLPFGHRQRRENIDVLNQQVRWPDLGATPDIRMGSYTHNIGNLFNFELLAV